MNDARLADRLADFNAYTLPFLPGLVAGEYPGREDCNLVAARLRVLCGAGVTYIIDLTEEGELSQYADQLPHGIIHRRHPIIDVSIPRDPAEMAATLDTIDEARAQGHTVYLHCWGGVGRTGTVAGCYLVRHGLPGDLALRTIDHQFLATAKGKRGRAAPETRAQKQFIRDWASHDPLARAHRWEDRLTGALVGLAVGDALGTTLEFTRPGTFTSITDIVGGGPFTLKPGQWTDDTSMALCLADSLIELGDFDPRDQMDRYVRWHRDGYRSSTGRCFDIGNTVRQALTRYLETDNPMAGSTDPFSAGNGSLMRLAPVAIHFAADPTLALARVAESSRTTHGAPDAVDACRYFAALLLGAFRGLSKDELLDPAFGERNGFWRDHPLAPNVAAVAAGHWRRENPPDIKGGSGYVIDTLTAALWAFHHSHDFRHGALVAVNLGGDADTTGAVYGQLAGAHYGVSGISEEWRAVLHDGDQIAAVARRLFP
jgi:ADP-ribosyl-[dinitrogen reductase] hydrolase